MIQLDDDYATAWAARCWINALDGIFRLTGHWLPDRATEVVEQCRESLALAPDNPVAHLALVAAEMNDEEAMEKTRKLMQSETPDTLQAICDRFAGDHDRQQQCLKYLLPT